MTYVNDLSDKIVSLIPINKMERFLMTMTDGHVESWRNEEKIRENAVHCLAKRLLVGDLSFLTDYVDQSVLYEVIEDQLRERVYKCMDTQEMTNLMPPMHHTSVEEWDRLVAENRVEGLPPIKGKLRPAVGRNSEDAEAIMFLYGVKGRV